MMSHSKKIILAIAFVALLGTVTNFVYLSPLLTILMPLCFFVFNKDKLARPVFWLYIYFFLFLIAAVLYDHQSLFKFGFYRRDGNFIISYAPLLILPLFTLKVNLKNFLRYFYLLVLILYTALFIYHFMPVGATSGFMSFGGLFFARNAVGGFLAIIASMGIAYFYNRRGKKELIFFITIFIIMVSTYSRGAVLAFVAAVVAWYFSITRRFKLLLLIISIPVLLTAGCLVIGYPYFKNSIETQTQVERSIGNDVDTKSANVILRIVGTFPRSFYLFLHSPIVGTGIGSYNDRPLQLKHIVPYVSYNAQPNKTYSNATAHHSYLNILGEQGIVGLGVFLVFWISIFWYLLGIQNNQFMRDFLIIAFFTETFVAFTGHRLTTPSNMLPFTIILGLFIAQPQTIRTYMLKKA